MKIPKRVAIVAATRNEVGWELDIPQDKASHLLPHVFGKPKRHKKTTPVFIELHIADRIFRVEAKCATIAVIDKEKP